MLRTINLLTLVGAIQGIFFGLVLLRLPGRHRVANRFLALFLLTFSVATMGAVAFVSRWVLEAPHLAMVHSPLGTSMGGFVVLYLLALTRKDFKANVWHWAIVAGPFLATAAWLIPFYRLPAAAKRAMLESSYGNLPTVWEQVFLFTNIVGFFCLLASFVILLRHERVIRDVYSNTRDKTLVWVRHFLYMGFAVFALCVLFSILFNFTWADAVSNLFFSIVIYVFGYRAIRQPEIFADVSADTLPEDVAPLVRRAGKYEKSGLADTQAEVLLARLNDLMLEKKIYLNPTLNLQQLARHLDIPPHQVSQLLNQIRGESFSDFVNRHRVAHFKQAVIDPANAHLSLLGVAFDSGFNSKATFNVVFKKLSGQTPSAYREGLSQGFQPSV